MLVFLTSQSLWVSGAILVGLTTALATIGPGLVRRYIELETLTTNNEIAGFKFATVGVLYAVLLAFAIIVVWEKYNQAEATVAQEAGAAATIYSLSYGIEEKPGRTVRDTLSNYLRVAIADDWPAMERGTAGASPSARRALGAVYSALLTFEPSNVHDSTLVSEILRQLDVITQARRARLIAAEGTVPGVIWLVLFGGAVLTIVFTFFFGTKNLRAQTMMTGLLSVLVFSELLIVVAIDRPFTGTVKVGPNALTEVLADFMSEPDTGMKPNGQQQR
jgi:hypothetical protein